MEFFKLLEVTRVKKNLESNRVKKTHETNGSIQTVEK